MDSDINTADVESQINTEKSVVRRRKVESKPEKLGNFDLSYARLYRRVAALLTSPRARRRKMVVIEKLPYETVQDWNRFMDEARYAEGLEIQVLDDGSFLFDWQRIK